MKRLSPRKTRAGVAAAGALLILGTFGQNALAADSANSSSDYPTVTEQRLMDAQQDNGWLMYSRDYSSRAYVQVMAFLLKENGYKPGQQPLTYEQAEKSKAPLVSRN